MSIFFLYFHNQNVLDMTAFETEIDLKLLHNKFKLKKENVFCEKDIVDLEESKN